MLKANKDMSSEANKQAGGGGRLQACTSSLWDTMLTEALPGVWIRPSVVDPLSWHFLQTVLQCTHPSILVSFYLFLYPSIILIHLPVRSSVCAVKTNLKSSTHMRPPLNTRDWAMWRPAIGGNNYDR